MKPNPDRTAKQERRLLVGEVAALLNMPSPLALTSAFYRGLLDRNRCPVIGNKRRIPESYVPEIRRILIANCILEG